MPTDQERWERVQAGSRRKRDLAGARRHEAEARALAERELANPAQLNLATDDGEVRPMVWLEAMQRVRHSVSEDTFRLWLEPLELAALRDGVAYVTAPEGIRAWVERRYASLLAQALQQVSDVNQVSFAPPPGPSR